MKCLIVDDELLARQLLEEYIGKIKHLSLVGSLPDAIEGVSFLQSNTVDLLFLDIDMPELSGIELLKALPTPPKVIFTTAYSEYALESYEYGVVDYLLKPIAFPRFLKAVNRALSVGYEHRETAILPKSSSAAEVLTIRQDGLTHRVKFTEICYVKSFGNYVKVITEKRAYIMLSTLNQIEQQLPEWFQRVHRSYIVSLNAITQVKQQALLVGTQEIPISATYRLLLLERWKS